MRKNKTSSYFSDFLRQYLISCFDFPPVSVYFQIRFYSQDRVHKRADKKRSKKGSCEKKLVLCIA